VTLPLQIDVTGILLAGLRPLLPAAKLVTETPDNLADVLPCARLERAGGGDDGVVLDTAVIQVDCFGDSPVTSRMFAMQVVGAMYALQGAVVNGATVTRVRKTSGPTALGYDNPAVRRQLLQFRVSVKPA
jgi:hypothetical protein